MPLFKLDARRARTTADHRPGECVPVPDPRGRRTLRASLVVTVSAAAIVAPALTLHGVGVSARGAQASETPRASATLPPVPFTTVQPDAEPEPAPAEFQSTQHIVLSAAELQALQAQGLAAAANQAHAVVPNCSGNVTDPNAANSRLAPADLCVLPWTDGKQVRADAALALGRLNADYFAAFGTDLCVNSAYRSYDQQAQVKAERPGLAAPAGLSNHGWGLAVDLCAGVQDDTSPQWAWMVANAPAYGWDNPAWARAGGTGPHEPWHFEYVSAVAVQKAAQAAQAAPTSTASTVRKATKRTYSRHG